MSNHTRKQLMYFISGTEQAIRESRSSITQIEMSITQYQEQISQWLEELKKLEAIHIPEALLQDKASGLWYIRCSCGWGTDKKESFTGVGLEFDDHVHSKRCESEAQGK